MTTLRLTYVIAVLALCILSGCSSAPIATVDNPAHRELNEGYALLYGLVNDNSDVGKILILKSVRPETDKLIREIAGACAATRTSLRYFAREDPTLGMDQDGLPALETQTRKAISDATAKDLLFSSGPDFETRLLLTQAESTEYAAHLSAMLAQADGHEARAKALRQWSEEYLKFRARVLALLTIKSSPAPPTRPAGG